MAAPEQRAGYRSGLAWGAGGALAFLLAAGAYWHARPGAPDLNDPGLIAAGRKVYAAHCAECHGGNLEGEPNWRTPNPDGSLPAPPHDATGHTWHHPDRVLFAITLKGGASAAPPGFPSRMPAFGSQLAEREIWAALAFIKSTWPADIRERQGAITRRGR
ncbi:MAG: cytochrome c [Rhodospirillales bacterium]|nr:cytochrome c [Rhodospirillales bacterium]